MSEKDIKDFNSSYEKEIQSIKLPERLRQDYRITDCLKESEIKKLYLLESTEKSYYVLKMFQIEYSSLLENEYHVMQQLFEVKNCPVPEPEDYWTDENHAYFLRKYIDGSSLFSLYESGYFSTNERILKMSMELCRIIEVLHEEKPPIIHRDVKPENFIWNKKEEKLYLIDCDSARYYKEGQERDTFFLGTPEHAAPEAYGYAQCDVRSDVYGIGKTILYMCCGRTDDEAVKDGSVSRELQKIIKKCVAFAPEERYPKVRQIYRELQKLHEQNSQDVAGPWKVKYVSRMLVVSLVTFALGIAVDRIVFRLDGMSHYAEKNLEDGESLAESADKVTINVAGYQDDVDRIVTCYYEMDLEGMGKAYDELFTRLYGARDLNALEWTDISKLEEVPENYPYKPYPYRVCDPLACYDRLLYLKIGNFQEYSGAIYGYLDFWLNEETANPDMPFYQYCNGTKEAREENYREALVEVINSALRGVMDQDQLEVLSI